MRFLRCIRVCPKINVNVNNKVCSLSAEGAHGDATTVTHSSDPKAG